MSHLNIPRTYAPQHLAKRADFVLVKLRDDRQDRRSRQARTLPWLPAQVMCVVPAGANPLTYLRWRGVHRPRRVHARQAPHFTAAKTYVLVSQGKLLTTEPWRCRAPEAFVLTFVVKLKSLGE